MMVEPEVYPSKVYLTLVAMKVEEHVSGPQI